LFKFEFVNSGLSLVSGYILFLVFFLLVIGCFNNFVNISEGGSAADGRKRRGTVRSILIHIRLKHFNVLFVVEALVELVLVTHILPHTLLRLLLV
jgi:hypothetical protein